MERDRLQISVVVPCFNEAGSIEELHRRVSRVCEDCASSHEMVIVDDGSTDESWAVLRGIAGTDPRVVLVRLSRNHGHQLALSAGLDICRGERVLILDADLQDPPELLPDMMRLMDAGAQVVYGRRRSRSSESGFKRVTASAFYRLLNRLVEIEIPADAGDFRLMSRKALNMLRHMPERHRFVRGMVTWIGLTQVALDYDRDPRFAGETKYPVTKMVRLAFDAITGFSTQPLRIASHLGIMFSLLAFAGILYALYSWYETNTVSGWTSLMVVVLLLGAIQLFVLGILGAYLGRVVAESKRRPLYFIDEIVSGDVTDTSGYAGPVAPEDVRSAGSQT